MYLKTQEKGKGKHNTKHGRRPKPHGLRTKDQQKEGGEGRGGGKNSQNEN